MNLPNKSPLIPPTVGFRLKARVNAVFHSLNHHLRGKLFGRVLSSLFSFGNTEAARLRNFSWCILFFGIITACIADISIYAAEPWQQLGLLLHGFITPAMGDGIEWRDAMIATLSFALLGVTFGALAGFLLSLVFQHRLVRALCAVFRAIHELFWALIFIQLFGLSAITGVLAITVPFACIFARVFNDIYQHVEIEPSRLFSQDKKGPLSHFSYFIYVLMPQVWPQMKDYIGYRLECAIRTSTVLGFVGLPTLGFYLETAFKQGNYSQSAAFIFSLLALIASIKYWFRIKFLPLYALIAWYLLPQTDISMSFDNIIRFFADDIWPKLQIATSVIAAESTENQSFITDFYSVLMTGWQHILAYFQWANSEMLAQGWQGIVQTLLLTMMAVSLTWLTTVLMMPWLSASVHSRFLSTANKFILLIMRSIPEYILAFVLLLLFGPSMLPAVIALAIHNSGLIGFLMNQRIARLKRDTKAHSISDHFYRIQPVIYPGFLALLLYRAEIILRESAILGMLGITTLGFYIDSAFEDFRLDRAFLLLAITALLNILLDYFAQKVQKSVINQPLKVQSR